MEGELDRRTAERALRRALELSGGAARGLTPGQLVAIGGELGVTEADVRRAIAETLAAPPQVKGMIPRSVSASRVVPEDAQQLTSRVDAWFEADGLALSRRPDPLVATWTPRRGGLAVALTAIEKLAGGDKALRDAPEVASTIEPIVPGTSVVHLDARIDGGNAIAAAVIGVGVAVVSLVAALWVPFAAFGVLLGAGAAAGLLQLHRQDARRIAVALERRLDRLAAGEDPPPRPLAGVAGILGRVSGKRRS